MIRHLTCYSPIDEEFLFWAKPRSEEDKANPRANDTLSVDVEMTAYCLLTYLQRGLVTEALPIMRWMVAQRNSNGGFASTQVLRWLEASYSSLKTYFMNLTSGVIIDLMNVEIE